MSAGRVMNATSFVLCAECLEKYRALRLDPEAVYALNVMPLCSLVWPDEHPGGLMTELPSGTDHKACLSTIMRLAGTRTVLWRTGELPENRAAFWNEAQRELPDWPGFQRLSLSPKQFESLDGCREELDDFLGAVRRQLPQMTVTSSDGVTHFRAEKTALPQRYSAVWFWRGVEKVGDITAWIVLGAIAIWLCVALLGVIGIVK